MNTKLLQGRSLGEKTFDTFNIVLMVTICLVTLYPIWYVLVNSFNDGLDATVNGAVYFWPREFSLDNYKIVFSNDGIMKSFGVTVAKTVVGTTVHVLFTAMVAYALSRRGLKGRSIYTTMGLITMFFGGGLIPTYLVIRDLGLLDSFWVYIIPAAFSFFDLLIFRSFFNEIPDTLIEAAKIDGASDFRIFFKVILPLSLPVLATIALFHGVYQWNDYFTGMIYVNDADLQPIQTYLYKIVSQTESTQAIASAPAGINKSGVTSTSIKLATMVVTTFPIVCVYPFLQKYFVKGMLIGSVK